ncbi:MAG: alpha/beta fold hydrolase [Rhodoferax sp.]|nr:alpha/beta fold hydrolase [Rhodoferax sp.]
MRVDPLAFSAVSAFLRRRMALVAWIGALGLSSCGGGSGGDSALVTSPADPVVITVGPGEFKTAKALKEFPAADIAKAISDSAGSLPAVTVRYAVKSYRLEYLTLGGDGKQVLASALVNVPVKPAGTSSPVLALQHGTISRDAEAPTNEVAASKVSVVLASTGYIVLAPDYVGYGSSKGQPHPYLLAAPSASVLVDLLTAAKYWRQTSGVTDNRQLFFVGYSEGAYVSMAAARSLASSISPHAKNLSLVVAGGGPYNVSATLDALLQRIRSENAVLGVLINPGFLKFLGDGARASVRNALLGEMLDSNADVTFQSTLIDNFLADNTAAIDAQSNVYDWKPSVPTLLFHGRDDQTVAYQSSSSTLQAMQSRGAAAFVSMADCQRIPSGHLECVPLFWQFVVSQLAAVAHDL